MSCPSTEKQPDGVVECTTCFRHCRIPQGKLGLCKTRENQEGKLIERSYGKITSLALDPIEKKPLNRFYPGSKILSFGSYGCSMRCPFCQNWEISQQDLDEQAAFLTPEELVTKAVELQPWGNIGLAATYNEPMLNTTYLEETFRLSHEKGMQNVIVTSGNVSLETLEKVLPYTDAFNIDLKGFRNEFYQWTGGSLQDVKAFIERAAQEAHVEITTLVIPGKNDSEAEIEAMAKWIAAISPDIPLHLSRYFPRYRCSIEATPKETLFLLQKAARKHLRYVYLGNI